MKLQLQGKPKKEIIVFANGSHNVGEPVEVFDGTKLVQRGKIVQDMSTVRKYQDAKKRIDNADVLFNAGRGYYKVKLEEIK